MGEMCPEDYAHAMSSATLSEGWDFRQTDLADSEWLPVSKVPSTVHQDLIDNKK